MLNHSEELLTHPVLTAGWLSEIKKRARILITNTVIIRMYTEAGAQFLNAFTRYT